MEPSPPVSAHPRVPSPQRRRHATRQRGAADSARIASNTPFLARPRPRLGLTQAIGGLALGLIALFSSYDHLTFAGSNIPIHQQWGIPLIAASVAIIVTGCVEYGARRDPGYEQSIVLHEQRMKQIESEILRVRSAGERSKERTKLIEKEIEQLDHENAKLKALNASIRRLCFPPESSSIPQTATATDCKLS